MKNLDGLLDVMLALQVRLRPSLSEPISPGKALSGSSAVLFPMHWFQWVYWLGAKPVLVCFATELMYSLRKGALKESQHICKQSSPYHIARFILNCA